MATLSSVIVSLFLLLSVIPAYSAVFNIPSGNVTALIAAINTANSNGEQNTINLEAGTYTLTAADNFSDDGNGLPLVTSVLTIQGMGAALTTIAAGVGGFRIVSVTSAGTLTLDGITVRGGLVGTLGGGISSQGTVTIIRSTITQNQAVGMNTGGGSVFNTGRMSIIGSSISGIVSGRVGSQVGGGGIANYGSLVISNSSINGSATFSGGGGIANFGSLVITNSQISGFAGRGGGVLSDGMLSVTNSTVARAISTTFGGGGMLILGGQVTISNSTIANNNSEGEGGGLSITDGTVSLQNTILARNIGGHGQNAGLPDDCSGALTSVGNNIIGDPSGCGITLQPTDLTGDPGLGDFIDDGAPGNGHFPLLANSPAINAANDAACPRTDQLNTPRRGICDIGAIEFYPVVNNLIDFGNVRTDFDPTPVANGPEGTFRITADFINNSGQTIVHAFAEVIELTNNDLLLNADGGAGGVGARVKFPDADSPFLPGATQTLEFVIGLQTTDRFTFLVNVLGDPQTHN